MRASERIKEQIKKWEGLRLHSYVCAGGKWTIGYGHTGADIGRDLFITPAKAQEIFDADVARHEAELNALLDGITLRQGQYDALLSFVFNLGVGNLRNSTLLRRLRANPDDPTIPAEFRRWVYAKGVKLPGLVRRRDFEARIYAER